MRAAHHQRAPVQGTTRYRVLYEVARRERSTAWFGSLGRAKQALRIVQAKHGTAILYVD